MAQASIKTRKHTDGVRLELISSGGRRTDVEFTVAEWSQLILTGKLVNCVMVEYEPDVKVKA